MTPTSIGSFEFSCSSVLFHDSNRLYPTNARKESQVTLTVHEHLARLPSTAFDFAIQLRLAFRAQTKAASFCQQVSHLYRYFYRKNRCTGEPAGIGCLDAY